MDEEIKASEFFDNLFCEVKADDCVDDVPDGSFSPGHLKPDEGSEIAFCYAHNAVRVWLRKTADYNLEVCRIVPTLFYYILGKKNKSGEYYYITAKSDDRVIMSTSPNKKEPQDVTITEVRDDNRVWEKVYDNKIKGFHVRPAAFPNKWLGINNKLDILVLRDNTDPSNRATFRIHQL